MSMFKRKSVFPAQREDEDEGSVKISQDAWNQMQQALGGLAESVKRLERKRPQPVVGQSPTARAEIALHEPKLDLAGLPDPVSDKDGFIREASKRLQTQLDTFAATIKGQEQDKAATARQAGAIQARVNGLWKKWQKKYSKFGKADKLVELEATKMVQEGLAAGMSVDDVMFADEEGFLDDLAERVGGELQAMGVNVEDRDPREVAEEVDQGLQKFSNMFKSDEMPDDADDRAASLREGDMGSITPKKRGKEADKPIPMTDQLRMAQEEMGII